MHHQVTRTIKLYWKLLLWCLGGLVVAFFAVNSFYIRMSRAGASPRLQHGQPSMQALAEKILEALAQEDKQVLAELALSKEEFRSYVWPELPVSNSRTNVPLDFVWNDVAYRSQLRLTSLFDSFKGRRFHLVRVVHRGKLHTYPTHRAFPDMEIVVKNDSGKEGELDLFGTLIELDGVFKVYSYAPYR